MSDKLENYYSGDLIWMQFVATFSGSWGSFRFKEELIYELNGQVDIAMVCCERFPVDVFSAIREKSPSLCGCSIKECCVDESLVRRSREMLMRMH